MLNSIRKLIEPTTVILPDAFPVIEFDIYRFANGSNRASVVHIAMEHTITNFKVRHFPSLCESAVFYERSQVFENAARLAIRVKSPFVVILAALVLRYQKFQAVADRSSSVHVFVFLACGG